MSRSLFFTIAIISLFPLQAQLVDLSWPELRGGVSALCVDEANGLVYLAGKGFLGESVPHMSLLDPVSGIRSADLPHANSLIYSAVEDEQNGVFIGGNFTEINGQPRSYIARLQSNLQLTPWTLDLDGPVSKILLANDTMFIIGSFTSVQGQPRNGIAAVDLSTNIVLPWAPVPNNPIIRDIQITPSSIYIGGAFTNMNGFYRQNLARFDRSTMELATSSNIPYMVHSLAYQNGDLHMGGNSYSRVNESTGLIISGSDASISGTIYKLKVMGDTLFIGGLFNAVNAISRSNFAAMDLGTGELLPLSAELDDRVTAIDVRNGTIYIGGLFMYCNGVQRARLAALDIASNEMLPWDPTTDQAISEIISRNDGILILGHFKLMNAMYFNGVAALDLNTHQPTGWKVTISGFPESISDMAVTENEICIVGNFDQVQGQPRSKIAVVDRVTSQPLPYTLDIASPEKVVAYGNTFYVGGAFPTVNGTPRNNLVAFDANTGTLLPWAGTNNMIRTMMVFNDEVYIGGTFTTVNGVSRKHLASINAVTGALSPLSTNISTGAVSVVATDGTTVYFGGFFNWVNGQLRLGRAALNLQDNALLPWMPCAFQEESWPISITCHDDNVHLTQYCTGEGLTMVDPVYGDPLPWERAVATVYGSTLKRAANRWFLYGASEVPIWNNTRLGFVVSGLDISTTDNGPIAAKELGIKVMGPGLYELQLPYELSGPALVQVFDPIGKLVQEHRMVIGQGHTDRMLDLMGHAPGIYLVKVSVHGGQLAARLVLEE